MERGLIKTSLGYMHYRSSGSGYPLVLLHGNAKSSVMFLELMEALPDDVRSIAIDFPSCGDSDHVKGELRVDDYVRVTLEMLDALGIERATVLGQAFSDLVATRMALASPKIIEKVILVNCPWYANTEAEVAGRETRNAKIRPTDENGIILTRSLEEYLALDPGHAPMNPTESYAERRNLVSLQAGREGLQMLHSSEREDENPGQFLLSSMSRLECPVLNLWGEHFPYTPHREDFARTVKGEHRTVVIEDTRFDPWVDRADEVSRQIMSFIR